MLERIATRAKDMDISTNKYICMLIAASDSGTVARLQSRKEKLNKQLAEINLAIENKMHKARRSCERGRNP